MRGKIENLGDYNTARIMLQEMDGNLPALVKKWADSGRRKQFRLDMLILGPACFVAGYAAKKVAENIEKRKKAKEKSEELEEELKAALLTGEEEPILSEKDEEPPC